MCPILARILAGTAPARIIFGLKWVEQALRLAVEATGESQATAAEVSDSCRMRGVRRLVLHILIFCFAGSAASASSTEERHAAIERALGFIHTVASDNSNFARYGGDLLWCLYSISHTSRDPELSAAAGRMARDLAGRWRASHRHVPANASAVEIYLLVEGAYAAERLGLPDARFKKEVRLAARRFNARDYLGFDPSEPPRRDDPKRYDVFTDALIRSYFGDAYGIPLGAHYRDVVRWLPRLRPYEGFDDDTEFDAFYAVTHVIYTLDRYHENSIAVSLLPEEFSFVRRKLADAIEEEDPEMAAEAIDCLKAAGLGNDAQVEKGIEYLIASQRADGAWAGDNDDVYTAYHSAWTGIDGLRDYRYRRQVKSLPWQ